jgi:hypothetical protein
MEHDLIIGCKEPEFYLENILRLFEKQNKVVVAFMDNQRRKFDTICSELRSQGKLVGREDKEQEEYKKEIFRFEPEESEDGKTGWVERYPESGRWKIKGNPKKEISENINKLFIVRGRILPKKRDVFYVEIHRSAF